MDSGLFSIANGLMKLAANHHLKFVTFGYENLKERLP